MGNIANGCADFKPELINDKNDKFQLKATNRAGLIYLKIEHCKK